MNALLLMLLFFAAGMLIAVFVLLIFGLPTLKAFSWPISIVIIGGYVVCRVLFRDA